MNLTPAFYRLLVVLVSISWKFFINSDVVFLILVSLEGQAIKGEGYRQRRGCGIEEAIMLAFNDRGANVVDADVRKIVKGLAVKAMVKTALFPQGRERITGEALPVDGGAVASSQGFPRGDPFLGFVVKAVLN